MSAREKVLFRQLTAARGDGTGSSLVVRRLQVGDYHKGFLELLGQLTKVPDVSFGDFQKRFDEQLLREKCSGKLFDSTDIDFDAAEYLVAVIEDTRRNKIIATASLIIERKFIRGCGKVGHVEDVVVDGTYRGKRLGLRVVDQLKSWAKAAGCYKIILDCAEHNVAFYNKLGFVKKEVQMACYF